LVLVVATLFVYWPATGHGFISLDDPEYVTANAHVQGGLTWDNIKWAFSHPVTGNWHPITIISHMLDYQMFGLKPWGHHLTSILLHAINTGLFFLLLRQLTGATWRSLVVATLFGLHPLHVESVAWVAERKDVLSVFLGLLTLMAYSSYAVGRPGKKIFFGLALLSFALGLMCKPMLVTIPFLMLLLDYWPLRRFEVEGSRFGVRKFGRLVVEKIPFFALTVAVCVTTYLVQQHAGAMNSLGPITAGNRLEHVLVSYFDYLRELFWPVNLAIYYPYPDHWPMSEVLCGGALLISISWLCIVHRARHPYLLTGWFWFLGTLVPVIGLVQVGAQAMADRYTYLPYVGLFIMIVWGAYEVAMRWRYRQYVLGAAGCATILACAGITRHQLGYWQNNVTLYRHAVAVTDDNYYMHYFLGVALFNEGKLDDAIGEYQEAIRIKPDYAAEHYDLGNAMALSGQITNAIAQYQEAIRLKPDYDQAFHGLGTVLGRMGQTDEAIIACREAVRLKPDNAQYHYDLGIILLIANQADGAIAELQEAIHIKPDFTQAQHYLAVALQIKNGSQKIQP
jgi:Flp pilus assembly protein TadD